MRENEQCKREGHDWTKWDLVWDERWVAIWKRYCRRGDKEEKSVTAPPELKRRTLIATPL
jgi:hypothetical protein